MRLASACISLAILGCSQVVDGSGAPSAPAPEGADNHHENEPPEGSGPGPFVPTPSESGGGEVVTPPVTKLPTVCGGAQGDGQGITTVDWHIYPAQKYRVRLGAGLDDLQIEPVYLVIPNAQIEGTVSLAPGHRVEGGGSSAGSFSWNALPSTTPGSKLGFSSTTRLLFETATKNAGPIHEVYSRSYRSEKNWTLKDPRLPPNVEVKSHFVSRLTATTAVSWVFTIRFDEQCKLDGLRKRLDSLDGAFAWSVPEASREEVQEYLVANKAIFKLSVLQTGTEDLVGLRVPLSGSQCSPADLAACKTMFDKIDAAKTTLLAAPLDEASYDTLVIEGNVGPWIIGAVEATPTTTLR